MNRIIDRPVVILGAGGHAKVLIDTLRQQGANILAVTDRNPELWGTFLSAVPIVGDDSFVKQHYAPEIIYLVNGLGSIRAHSIRADLFIQFKQLAYQFTSVIHPSVQLAIDVILGEGVQCLAGSILQAGVWVGDNVIINTGAIVDHDCMIESHAHLAPRVVLSGSVQVGNSAHLGTGSVVIQGIRIEEFATIGAGAVVIHRVSAHQTVVGIPAKSI